jgi:hypothetical protein
MTVSVPQAPRYRVPGYSGTRYPEPGLLVCIFVNMHISNLDCCEQYILLWAGRYLYHTQYIIAFPQFLILALHSGSSREMHASLLAKGFGNAKSRPLRALQCNIKFRNNWNWYKWVGTYPREHPRVLIQIQTIRLVKGSNIPGYAWVTMHMYLPICEHKVALVEIRNLSRFWNSEPFAVLKRGSAAQFTKFLSL